MAIFNTQTCIKRFIIFFFLKEIIITTVLDMIVNYDYYCDRIYDRNYDFSDTGVNRNQYNNCSGHFYRVFL